MFKTFFEMSADRYEKMMSIISFTKTVIFIQRGYRAMRKSRAIKRQLINDLWDDYIEENTQKLQNVGKLNWQMMQTKSKAQRVVIQKKIESEPKSILNLDQLLNITIKDRDVYMTKYFEMRLLDYSI